MTEQTETQGGIDVLTDGERAVLDAEATRVADEAAAAQAAADKQAADQAAAKAAAEAPPPAPEPPPVAQVPQVPVLPTLTVDPAQAARDFNAELATLQAQWDEGELDQAGYNKAMFELATARAKTEMRGELAQEFAAHTQQTQAQTFEQMSIALLQQPENRDILDPTRFSIFQGLINTVDKETGGTLDNAALLQQAHARFRSAIPAQPLTPPPPPVREPVGGEIPPRLGGLPAAATATVVHQDVQTLANMSIEDTEAALMKMSPDALDELLAKTPGSSFEIVRNKQL